MVGTYCSDFNKVSINSERFDIQKHFYLDSLSPDIRHLSLLQISSRSLQGHYRNKSKEGQEPFNLFPII